MTEPKLEEVKFGKFWMTAQAKRIIWKLTKDEEHGSYTGLWLVRDRRIVRRATTTDTVLRMPARALDTAEVHLGFGFLTADMGKASKTPFFARVPYRASRQEIEDGWMEVAFKVYCVEAKKLARLIIAEKRRNDQGMRTAYRLLHQSSDPATRAIANRLLKEMRAAS